MLWQVLSRSHQLLFGHEMTLFMRQFLRHLSLSLTGYVVGNSILFIAIVVAGRLLGPYQFGRYALVMAIAQILIIPMLPGTDVAVMRETALRRGARRRRAISSGFVFTIFTSFTTALLAFVLAQPVITLLDLDIVVWRVAVVVALAVTVRTFFDSVIRGKGEWHLQMLVRMLDAAIVLAVLAASLWLFALHDFRALVAGIVAGALVAGLLFLARSVHGHLSYAAMDVETLRTLWRYGRFGVLGATGGILLVSADKVIIGNLLGTTTLGIYQAYYFASVQLAGQVGLIFLNVFFPTIVRQQDLTAVLHKIDRLVLMLFAPALFLVALWLTFTLWLFSHAFGLDARLIALMSLYGVLWFLYLAYWTLMASTGPQGMLYASATGLLAGGLFILAVLRLVPSLGIFAPGISFLLTSLYLAAVVLLWRWRFRHTLR